MKSNIPLAALPKRFQIKGGVDRAGLEDSRRSKIGFP
jgi:hypothetical protein